MTLDCGNFIVTFRKAVKELFEEDKQGAKKQQIAAASWEDFPEDGYFGMYTHFSIHETMLKVCSASMLASAAVIYLVSM